MHPLEQASCASIPHAALTVLAGLRGSPDVRVQIVGDRAWLRWSANDEQVLRLLLPVPGVEFFVWHEGQWYRPGSLLPVAGVPEMNDPMPLHRALFPEPVVPIPAKEPSG